MRVGIGAECHVARTPGAPCGLGCAASTGACGRADANRRCTEPPRPVAEEDQSGMQHLVVDTGVWVFGKSVLIPAGALTRIDTEAQAVRVSATQEEIKAAPRFTTDSETGR
ncbi:PRC-barrel domain containing protein [Streptomyces sp. DSM 116496]|uniref:PRC-barrel domain containing protein n=1 Tax=Streptomyces stoeckheimensis TaxID=3344656 RepID=UPI0038B2EDE7